MLANLKEELLEKIGVVSSSTKKLLETLRPFGAVKIMSESFSICAIH